MPSQPRIKDKRELMSGRQTPDKFEGLSLSDGSNGRREYVNSLGIPVYRELTPNSDKWRKVQSHKVAQSFAKETFDKVMINGVEAYVPRGTAKFFQSETPRAEYSQPLADYICSLISEGFTLSQICREEGMPSIQTIIRWTHVKPEFNQAYEAAKKTRAIVFHDKILETANQTSNWKEVSVSDLKIKTMKWAAQVGNPQEFDPKPQEAKLPPIQIVIDTGIQENIIQVSHTKTDSTTPQIDKDVAS